ncbi:membrane family protein [Hibiscus syriacus]|uniref:Membrane family protein n=1 Tax=Hibiscus syriacus TaxID=106335 RepID=A0A6A2WUT3_HIBSY|nr:uncharacterized protein LOC120182919 [Hibiscus syriacus]KAE8664801.1 membrane family protein [Hibiscus syriacus]
MQVARPARSSPSESRTIAPREPLSKGQAPSRSQNSPMASANNKSGQRIRNQELLMLEFQLQCFLSSNVCIAGHSLGAGFALQVGKALAKEDIYVDANLFNPPSISLAMSLRNIGEKAGFAWKRLKLMLPSSSEPRAIGVEGIKDNSLGLKNWLRHIYGEKASVGLKQWVPHLYVNNSDYICCHYTDPDRQDENDADKENVGPSNGQAEPKLFVMSKGKQTFLEANGLEQWWSDDLDLQLALNKSKLISRQLKSLYSLPATQVHRRPR